MSHKTYTDLHEALQVDLRTEVVGSINTGVIPFLEAQIAAMENQLEKLSTNSAHETCSVIWSTDCEVEGHNKDSFLRRSICLFLLDWEIYHLNHDSSHYSLLQHVIRKNASCYCKNYRSTTHDKKCRLIGQIHDAIDIGVR